MKRQIGLKIKAIRKIKKITQEVLAEKCGLSIESISNIERGVNYPHFDTLIQISKILDCSLSDILDDTIDCSSNSRRIMEETALIARIKKLSDEKISVLIKLVDALN